MLELIGAVTGTGTAAHIVGMIGRRVWKNYTDPKRVEARRKKKYEKARVEYQGWLDSVAAPEEKP